MPFITKSVLLDFFGVIIALIVIVISLIKWRYQYWKNRNVPYLEPSIPFGNMEPPQKRTMHFGELLKKLYDITRSQNLKYNGLYLFTAPALLVTDLDLLKNIFTKDFQHFTDRGFYYNEKSDPLSAHLFLVGGQKWRNLRTKITPTFTSGKMKQMFQTLLDCALSMDRLMDTKYQKSKEPIDVKNLLSAFTLDVIGSCAFGLDCKTIENEDSPFRIHGKKIFEQTKLRAIKASFSTNFPKIAKYFNLKLTPNDVSEFYTKVVTETVEYREKNNIERKDFLQLLINIKNQKNLEPNDSQNNDGTTLTMNQVIAQCFVFFVAGFDTSSTVMSFALYELAKNPEIQEKVQNEIETVLAKHEGKITYDSLSKMKYLSQVLDETLRKYPPASLLTRQCVKDYPIPKTDIVIEKDTRIIIPVYGIHMDPEYYPEPQKFDPERFNEENKEKRHQYAYLPFGEGPRICIGMRFGLMQAKVCLTTLLRKYKFSVNPRTKEPLKINPLSFITTNIGGTWLNATKLK